MNILVFVVLMTSWCQNGHPLHKRWESVTTSRGGIGAVWEFTARGQFIMSPGALVRGRYTADSSSVTWVFDGEPASIRLTVRVSGDTLIQFGKGKSDSVVMLRSRPSTNGSPIIGEWTYQDPKLHRAAFMRYRADSTFRLWIPFRTDTLQYLIHGDTIDTGTRNTPRWFLYSLSGSGLELRTLFEEPAKHFSFVKERD